MRECEKQVLSFVSEHTPRGVCPLAGNSVGEDKRFLSKYMPELVEHLASYYTKIFSNLMIFSESALTFSKVTVCTLLVTILNIWKHARMFY